MTGIADKLYMPYLYSKAYLLYFALLADLIAILASIRIAPVAEKSSLNLLFPQLGNPSRNPLRIQYMTIPM